MKLTHDQFKTTTLTCKKCGWFGNASEFRRSNYGEWIYSYPFCTACDRISMSEKVRRTTIKVFEPTPPEPFENMYKKKDGNGRRIDLKHRKQRYKLYCATHIRVQAELQAISEAGFDVDYEGDTEEIDNLLDKR